MTIIEVAPGRSIVIEAVAAVRRVQSNHGYSVVVDWVVGGQFVVYQSSTWELRGPGVTLEEVREHDQYCEGEAEKCYQKILAALSDPPRFTVPELAEIAALLTAKAKRLYGATMEEIVTTTVLDLSMLYDGTVTVDQFRS